VIETQIVLRQIAGDDDRHTAHFTQKINANLLHLFENGNLQGNFFFIFFY